MVQFASPEKLLQREGAHIECSHIDVGPQPAGVAMLGLVGLIAEASHWSVSELSVPSSPLYSSSAWLEMKGYLLRRD